MNQHALKRIGDWMKEQDLAAALLSNPFNITWLTGYAPPIQTGPSPFEGGPALFWLRGDRLVMLTSDMESGAARASGVEVQDYVAYTIEAPIAGSHNQAEALRALLGPDKALAGKVGVEFGFLPAPFVEVLKEALPNASVQALDGRIEPLRAVKSADEIGLIRSSLKLCDSAQMEVRKRLHSGVTEIELWNALKTHLEGLAAGRLPVLADLVAGSRTAEIGGLPGDYKLQDGDPVIVDVVPRLAGYWGDNAGTHFVGEPSEALVKIYKIVRETLQLGVEAVRPGIRACDLDEMLRAAIRQQGYPVYPHHSGHGIGTSYHEEPRIVPYNTTTLEPGMIVALEPGIYMPEIGGVRLEDVVLVTEDGCELLTFHLVE
jgi:Xaa-Pro aminopeptidase